MGSCRQPSCRLGTLFIAISVLLATSGGASAQAPVRTGTMQPEDWVQKQWTVDDGLPQNSVNDLVIDQAGFLWLATYDGLARFDGARFTIYRAATAPGTFPSDRVTTLALASDGRLWIGTEGGVAIWDGYRFHSLTTENGLPNNFVNDIAVGADGSVWVSTEGASPGSTVRLVAGKIDAVIAGPEGSSPPAERLLAMNKGVAWSMGRNSVYRLPGAERHALVDPTQDALKGLFLRNDGMLVVASEFGRLFARNTAGQFEEYKRSEGLSELHTWAAQPAGQGESAMPSGIWAGSVGAVHFLADGTGSRAGAEPDVTIPLKGAPMATVRSILPGPNGQIWVGTNGRGLIQLKPALFEVYGSAKGLTNEVALSVTEAADGTVWVGTNCGGVYRIPRSNRAEPVSTPLIPDNACVYSVLGAKNGDVWIGHEYLVRYRNGSFTRFGQEAGLAANVSLRSDFIVALYEDPETPGTLWVGTQEGMQRFDGTRFHDVPGSEDVLHPHVRSFLRDSAGRLWIATRGGVNILDGESMTGLTLSDGLSSLDVRAFLEAPSGDILIGTYGGGLARWQPPQQISVIGQGDGLFENVVSSLMIAENNLWMSGNRGVSRVPLADLDAFFRGNAQKVTAIGYQQESGLRVPETNGGFQPAAWKAGDGSLWYPTLGGAVRVEPKRAVMEPIPPKAWINTEYGDFRMPGVLTLEPGVRDVEIPYVGIDLMAPERMAFRYRLDGFNDDWVYAGSRREAIFTNLPPGAYTFRVEASGPTGAWSLEPAVLDMVVVPLFYEHWLFHLGLLMVLGALAAGGVRAWSRARSDAAERRERELNRIVALRTHDLQEALETISLQTEQLKELDRAKTRFFANTSHEFRTPLSLILAPVQKLLDGAYGSVTQRLDPGAERDLHTVLENAERLRDLTGQLLDLARMKVGGMTLERTWVDVVDMVGARVGMFLSAAVDKNIDLTCTSSQETIPFLCDEQALETILINLISNAINHTPDGGRISVCLDVLADGDLSMTVENTGSGLPDVDTDALFEPFFTIRDDKHEGIGLGLAIAREYVALHGGSIAASNMAVGGARFMVLIPPADEKIDRTRRVHALPPAPMDDAEDEDEADATHVLVIDDHDDLRQFIAESLPEYQVLESNNARDGLELARTHLPDAIISDVMMPGMDGIAFCREIRSDRRTNHIPVILLTARVDTESRMQGLQAGADDYIEKPFRTDELRLRMANILRRREQLQAWLRESTDGSPVSGGQRRVAEVEAAGTNLEPARETDREFVDEINRTIAEEIENAQFGVDALAESLSLSRRQLTRKLKALLGQSPGALIRARRMEHARLLLSTGDQHVSDVARRIGYSSASHFSHAFQEHFGQAPSDVSN